MNEPYYSILCWAIRLCPALFMALAWIIGYDRGWETKQLVVTLLVGYFTGIAATWCYWDFAAAYAPTSAIADEILNKDGAPQLLAPIVMPILVGIYFVIMWPFAWAITKAFPRERLTDAPSA